MNLRKSEHDALIGTTDNLGHDGAPGQIAAHHLTTVELESELDCLDRPFKRRQKGVKAPPLASGR